MKTVAFIDASNLSYGGRKSLGWSVDYQKLESFGYTLRLKPLKTYGTAAGNPLRKANCDVDMTLLLATEADFFDRAIVLSGDGDFLPVLKYLREAGKEILVLVRGPRTAKEIRQFAGSKFLDFEYLREILKRDEI